jgi:hypothetical protein
LGARTLAGDPHNPWWAIATFAALSAIATGLAQLTLHRGYLYSAGILVNLAVTIWHLYTRFALSQTYFFDLIMVNVIALSVAGLALLAFERKAMPEVKSSLPPYHHFAAILALIGVALPVLMGLTSDYALAPLHLNFGLNWAALATTVAIMIASLWDMTAKYAVSGLYVLGLMAAGMALDQANLRPSLLTFVTTIIVATYIVITSWIWAEKQRLIEWAITFGIPRRAASSSNWLVTTNTFFILAVTLVNSLIILSFELFQQRFFAAVAVLLQSLAFALLARGATSKAWLQTATFVIGIVGLVFCDW